MVGVGLFVRGASGLTVRPGRTGFETGPSIGLHTRLDAGAGGRREGRDDGSGIRPARLAGAEVGPITLTFTGTVEGDRMSGAPDFGGYADGSWEAERR